jgi:hypothetical protein
MFECMVLSGDSILYSIKMTVAASHYELTIADPGPRNLDAGQKKVLFFIR